MEWDVRLTGAVKKSVAKLPPKVRNKFYTLALALRKAGPVQPSMPHFGKLKNRPGECYHCHLNKGRPTYVAVWQVLDNQAVLVEVTYVGTHEKAPY